MNVGLSGKMWTSLINQSYNECDGKMWTFLINLRAPIRIKMLSWPKKLRPFGLGGRLELGNYTYISVQCRYFEFEGAVI